MTEAVKRQLDKLVARLTPQEKHRLSRRLARARRTKHNRTLPRKTRPADVKEQALVSSEQLAYLKRHLAEVAKWPVAKPEDAFSGADHDKLLYGKH